MSRCVEQLLVFLNAHLALASGNQVAVIGCISGHRLLLECVLVWLSPVSLYFFPFIVLQFIFLSYFLTLCPASVFLHPAKVALDKPANCTTGDQRNEQFSIMNATVRSNLVALLATAAAGAQKGFPLSSALSKALCRKLEQGFLFAAFLPGSSLTHDFACSVLDINRTRRARNISEGLVEKSRLIAVVYEEVETILCPGHLSARILTMCTTVDVAQQYLPLMNSIFAGQAQVCSHQISRPTISWCSDPVFFCNRKYRSTLVCWGRRKVCHCYSRLLALLAGCISITRSQRPCYSA